MKLVGVEGLSYSLWRQIVSLYLGDPAAHCYLLYDLIYQLDRSTFLFLVEEGRLRGYVLAWRGAAIPSVHVYGPVKPGQLLGALERRRLRLHIPQRLAREYLEYMRRRRIGHRVEGWFLDMHVDRERFRPCREPKARRLSVEDVDAYMELKKVQGFRLTHEEAAERLRTQRYYGVYSGGRLVSIAAAYLRLPEVWAIGDVYTHPDFRGRGYATACTSAVTEDALSSGAAAILHVNEKNEPAVRVYRRLGYTERGRRLWVTVGGEAQQRA